MFNIGAGEMIFILVAALLVLGPSRLPEMARGIGKFLREFRRQTDEVRTVVTREFYQMDQEIQREPVRPAPARVAPTPALAEPSAAPALGLPAAAEPGPYDHMLPSPMASGAPAEAVAPVEPSSALVEPVALQGVQPSTAAGASEAAAGKTSEEEEAVPRFAPLPGTVARNAPKQS